MSSDRCRHVPFLSRQVDIDSRVENLITDLVFGLNFLEGLGGILKQSQLTIPVRSKHCFSQLAFKGGDSSEEDKKRFCGNPSYQQESASCYGQHQERAEMMIVTLTAQGRLSSTVG